MNEKKVRATMATMYKRLSQALTAIKSIAPQVDQMFVVLNVMGKEDPVEWSNAVKEVHPNVITIVSNNRLGCGERFIPVVGDGIWFSCDDDLIYPEDYVKVMRARLDDYGGIVSAHGRYFITGKIDRYHSPGRGNVEVMRCLYDYPSDIELHVPGAGVMAWDGEEVDLSYHLFKRKNMDDVEVGRLAAYQGVSISGIGHKAGWIVYNDPGEDTIWNSKRDDDAEETEVARLIMELRGVGG